jgi:flagellar biogenesis protein FliO
VGDFFASLMRLLIALTVVFGLLFGLRWYMLRRAPFLTAAPAGLLRVRERVWLAGRTQALILDIGEESFLVCTNDHNVQITPLAKLPPPLPADYAAGPNFAAHLEQMLTFLRQGGKQ